MDTNKRTLKPIQLVGKLIYKGIVIWGIVSSKAHKYLEHIEW